MTNDEILTQSCLELHIRSFNSDLVIPSLVRSTFPAEAK